MVGRMKKSHDRKGAIGFETPFPSSMRQNHEQRHSVVVKAETINPEIRKTEEKVVDSVVIEELSKPLTAYCKCWRSGNFPLEGCDPSWTIETTKARPNASDLDAAFRELMAVNWLINGYETLSIDRDAARAVMVLNKLGFADAMGLYKSCSYLFEHRRRSRALPFNEGSFDFVVSTEMIDGVKVPARMVLEMARVLRPARVGVVMRQVTGNFPVMAVMKAAAPVAAFLRFSDVVAEIDYIFIRWALFY